MALLLPVRRGAAVAPGTAKRHFRCTAHAFGPRGSSGHGWYKKYEEGGPEAFVRYAPPTPFDWANARQTSEAFFQFSIDGEKEPTVKFELLDQLLPVTVANFKALCTGRNAHGLGYKGTPLHRIVKGAAPRNHEAFALVGGDVELKSGVGSHSAYKERYFEDESHLLPHSGPGILSMVNGGVDTNGSQFYVTTQACAHLDGYSVAFGRVTEGMDTINKIAGLYSIRGRPVSTVTITDAGIYE